MQEVAGKVVDGHAGEARAVVRVLPGRDGLDSAVDVLVDVIAAFLQVPTDQVRLGRRCPQCAGTDHGRRVVAPIEGSRVHMSISRTRGRTAVAVGSSGPLGVDIEKVDPDRFRGVDAIARHADEPGPGTLPGLAARWVRKEAVLKATGWGVSWGPERVDVTSDGRSPFPVSVNRGGRRVQLWVTDIAVGTGYAAAVAVVSPTPPRVLLLY